jgi:hypothetical protein
MALKKFQVWYMNTEFFRKGIMGFDFMDTQGTLPDFRDLKQTHIHLMDTEARDLEHLFHRMQGEMWSPNGEARDLIESKGLHHTSMSVGDIAVDENGDVHLVDRFGFVQLKTGRSNFGKLKVPH